MKRTVVWIDAADEDSAQVRKLLKEFLAKAGLVCTIFEALDVMESEAECLSP